ncbi:MAG: alpha/beta hydrolase [Bacteroidota bacterium]
MNNKLPKGKGISSALNFDLTMDPAVRQALKDNGMDRLDTSAFPDLNTWREEVQQYGFAVAAAPTPYDGRVTVKDQMIASSDGATIRLRIYRPSGIKTGSPALYWIHGGGLMGGTPEQDDAQMKQIAAETGAKVISVDYRLAPEFPYPVPINDCFDGLVWVAENAAVLGIDTSRIAVGGASAGGGLAAALTLMVKERGGPKLIHQSLTYPMLDDRNVTNSSYQINATGVWDRAYNIYGWTAYLGNKITRLEIPSTAAAAREKDLSGLPPAFIAVGSLDLFRDEDIEFALRLMEAGVSAELHFYHGAVHGFDWHVPASAMTASLLGKRINALNLAFKY